MILNIGIQHLKTATVKNFAGGLGIRLRRGLQPLLRRALRLGTRRRVIVERYPTLEKGKPYIFTSTHFFDEDVIANLISMDRNAWILFGTTNQLEYNRQTYAAWLNGMIYIDRMDAQSRKDSVAKMKRILQAGSSILMFPEGGWNNTENLLIQKLFPGPWKLAAETGCQVVPVAAFHDLGADVIYMRYGDPLELGVMEREEAMGLLRDTMATMLFEMMEAHAAPLRREELPRDLHLWHMETRRQAYLRVPWTRDVWDEELTVYQPRDVGRPEEVWAFVDDIAITPANAHILAPILVERERARRYDFKAYMKRNWTRKA